MLSRLKMSQKIIGGFIVVVLLLGAAIAYQILVMQKLAGLEAAGAKHGKDVVRIGHIMETMDMSYGLMADAVINRHLDKTRTALAKLEEQVARDTELLLSLVDTDEEKTLANDHIAKFKDYRTIFKEELLPLLTAKAGDSALDAATMTAIAALNEKIIEKREAADAPLAKIVLSLERKVENANQLFDRTRTESISFATIIGLLAAIITMTIAFIQTRNITRPINDCVRDLTSSSDQIAAAAGQVSTASQSLADGSSEQASALEETSASMEELTAMTRQNADNADHADSLMKQSLTTIASTNTAMGEMDHSMAQIAAASEQTFKIIKTIDEIAFQTNLLALNAAVEAARAGEAGAGFAVVADEVRNLAMRATEAAKNTASLIEDTVQKVKAGKEIVSKVTEAFQEVTESSTKVGSLLGEISVASKEQAQGIGQINQAITQMDSVTQQNAASSEESAAAAEELNSQAESMLDIVIALKTLVDGEQLGGKRLPRASKPVPPPSSSPVRRPKPPAKPAAKAALAAPPPKKKAPTQPVKKQPPAVDPELVIPMDDTPDNFADF